MKTRFSSESSTFKKENIEWEIGEKECVKLNRSKRSWWGQPFKKRTIKKRSCEKNTFEEENRKQNEGTRKRCFQESRSIEDAGQVSGDNDSHSNNTSFNEENFL